MNISRVKFACICAAIAIASIFSAPAHAIPVNTFIYFDIKNVTGLSPTLNSFIFNATNNKISNVNLSFSDLTDFPLSNIVFDSGSINKDKNTLTFKSSTYALDTLIISLTKNTTLNSSNDPLYKYTISSATIYQYITKGRSGDEEEEDDDDEDEQKRVSSNNLVQKTRRGDNVTINSFIQDPPAPAAPEPLPPIEPAPTPGASVPEPSTIGLILTALIGFSATRRKENLSQI